MSATSDGPPPSVDAPAPDGPGPDVPAADAVVHAKDPARLDPSDPYARAEQTFPTLDDEQVARLKPYATQEDVADGAMLFERGQRGVDFFVITAGAVEIVEHDPAVGDRVFSTHGAGQFTGEMDLFNDREILVSGRAKGPATVLRVPRDHFQTMLTGEPDVAEIVMRAFILRRTGLIQHEQGGVLVIGDQHDGDTLRIMRFMTRNGYPHRHLSADDPELAREFPGEDFVGVTLPVVVLPGPEILRNPATPALADALGLTEPFDPEEVFDVAVVGAGPGGLAAAVYAASEGLKTIVLESTAPGGQAGTSSKIENYLGFPTGISGQALAGRAQAQAQKFGAQLAIARAVDKLECAADPFVLTLEGDAVVNARAVIVASGARYRKLDIPNYAKYEGQGIHYAATAMEANLCGNEEVIVVGGGNSSGQAAVFLSRTAGHVHVLIRGEKLAETMSDYLVQRIETSDKITLHPFTEVTGLAGDPLLDTVTWTNRQTGAQTPNDVRNLFVMIGAEPNTEWLDGCLPLDAKGFVRTGRGADGKSLDSPFATQVAGIFAVGDVRAGSVKRVASSVGEGSVVIHAVHGFLNPIEG